MAGRPNGPYLIVGARPRELPRAGLHVAGGAAYGHDRANCTLRGVQTTTNKRPPFDLRRSVVRSYPSVVLALHGPRTKLAPDLATSRYKHRLRGPLRIKAPPRALRAHAHAACPRSAACLPAGSTPNHRGTSPPSAMMRPPRLPEPAATGKTAWCAGKRPPSAQPAIAPRRSARMPPTRLTLLPNLPSRP